MFDWIVEAVNVQLAKETTSTCLGVLDIYGFEIFEVRACVRGVCVHTSVRLSRRSCATQG